MYLNVCAFIRKCVSVDATLINMAFSKPTCLCMTVYDESIIYTLKNYLTFKSETFKFERTECLT